MVLTPPVCKNFVSMLSADSLGVMDLPILKVRESFALLDDIALLLLPELVLLAVGRVPDIVDTEISNDQRHNEPNWPVVLVRVVGSDKENRVAVREGYTGHVPEDEHEAELLVVHVPSNRVSPVTQTSSRYAKLTRS